ncbi:MAG: N-6 DNA methylase [Acidobacteriota bacterium]|nr:N-6 DNA methylase [Acidobacteriota bacterium]
MARIRKSVSALFDAVTLEGGLISPAMLARIAARNAGEQSEADYGVPKGLTLRDEIARYYRIGQAQFKELFNSPTPSTNATINFVSSLLRDVFGFSDVRPVGTRSLDGRNFAVTLEGHRGRVPIVVVPPADDLDHASIHLPTDGRRRSAASSVQDWLNANSDALWGFCCNGERIRLVRDNASLTRPAYVEANLRQLFEGENFADFAALWLLIHSTRFGAQESTISDCTLEHWREAGSKEGLVARDRLRDGVETALLALGNGFLSHPDNGTLRERLAQGELPLQDFFGQLLRLVYRLIFLLAAEDRGLLHPPGVSTAVRKLYADGYSLGSLRDRAVRRTAWDRHHDRWEGLLITFAALAEGEQRLGIPALGGLFSQNVISDLESAHLANRSLMEAIYRLAWLKDDSILTPVNWRDMETEELGSVYESLLELTPRLLDHGRGFTFAEGAETKGNERKTSGSYYTPDSLVQALLDSALDPVLNRVEAEANDPVEALLEVTVIDPACGSGHFLLAAARRIATRLARARTGGVAAASDYRHALRDVVRSSIHGVDRNPMAVELTKVALWIETVEPGKPLGFLDSNIRCGDALLGVFDLEVLRKGIPDAAYKPLAGDDKVTARDFAKRNKAEREGQGALRLLGGSGQLPSAPPLAGTTRSFRALPEDDPAQIERKRKRFAESQANPDRWKWHVAADVYVAAFLVPKTNESSAGSKTAKVPTTEDLWHVLQGGQLHGPLFGHLESLAADARVFHWPLEFADVLASGGFDVVLGNPPWDVMQLGEEEYFARRRPEIAELVGDARKRAIANLETEAPAVFLSYETAKRRFEATNEFARESGRFNLTARGKINTFALFAELFSTVVSLKGRAGLIVPTQIATADTTKLFFESLLKNNRIISFFNFFEIRKWFPDTDDRNQFGLLTLGNGSEAAEFAFSLESIGQLLEPERRFTLSSSQIAKINPNTKTAPIFRSRADARLTAEIFARVPPLIDESKGPDGNPWNLDFRQGLFNITSDSGLFQTASQLRNIGYTQEGNDWINSYAESTGPDQPQRYVPLYEAKMVHQFDHRWATYSGTESRDLSNEEMADPSFEPTPRYWVSATYVSDRLSAKGWTRPWLMGWRDICRPTDERSLISSIIPEAGCVGELSLLFPNVEPNLASVLFANLNSTVCDYVARQKMGGSHLKQFTLKQLPVLPPIAYEKSDLAFIVPRVLELTFTSQSMAPFANDLGYNGPPFAWDEKRRAELRGQLDAWYARAYGLTRDELRYILDPLDVRGATYPSETFRVLKNNEIRLYGEYRTGRLTLEAWDRMDRGEIFYAPATGLDAQPAVTVRRQALEDPSTLPDGEWEMPNDSVYSIQAQLAAILKALPGPTSMVKGRLAALYALQPRYLTHRLSGPQRSTWRRLVGTAAEVASGTNTVAFVPTMNANWRDAYTQLRGIHALVEDNNTQTWTAGAAVHEYETRGWPDGRAAFVLQAIEALGTDIDQAIATLPVAVQAWVRAYAA